MIAIGDYVWDDLNGNGLQDSLEPAFAGITIRLYTQTDVLVATTQTDNNGHYRFAGLSPGAYFLLFDPQLFPPGCTVTQNDQGSDDELDSDADPTLGVTVTFNLAAGTTDLSWDAGLTNCYANNIKETPEPSLLRTVWLPLISQ